MTRGLSRKINFLPDLIYRSTFTPGRRKTDETFRKIRIKIQLVLYKYVLRYYVKMLLFFKSESLTFGKRVQTSYTLLSSRFTQNLLIIFTNYYCFVFFLNLLYIYILYMFEMKYYILNFLLSQGESDFKKLTEKVKF